MNTPNKGIERTRWRGPLIPCVNLQQPDNNEKVKVIHNHTIAREETLYETQECLYPD